MTITAPTTTSPLVPTRLRLDTDRTDVVTALARSFAEDPVFCWLFEDPARRAAAIHEFFDAITPAVAAYDRSWTADQGNGVALWVPAGEPTLDDGSAEALGALLSWVGETGARRTQVLIEAMEHEHPAEPHEYLWFLGVVPERQGRGLGSALLAEGLAEADQVGLPCYLEATSPHNKALYERYGFVAGPTLSVLDGPPLWPMRRAVGGR